MLLRTGASSALRRRSTTATGPLACVYSQQRFIEYWGATVTGRTQAYAQGDMLPRVDNTRYVVNKASSAAASLTGNPNGIAYDASNIFHVEGFSPLEKDHYQPLRGIATHKAEPLAASAAKDAAVVLKDLMEEGAMEEHWWGRVLKDFPSMKKPCTPEFRSEWEKFYAQACEVAHDNEAVKAMAQPFLRTQMQVNYISYAMVWRLAERLCDALDTAADVNKYERRVGRLAVERVTKLMLDTIADEPWSNQDATNPLFVDVSNFRAWHEAGNW
ncbi:putative mitochondrial hypothetical protein [Leptomonas pyrrhocoris]|uniref:Uncharacterized protein n=1 Tax=Leptomonas pyrrhocoris TaxID=157538 RepID=A0A0N0DVP2_LEPPY|nr:putative mitochondrial hypothetical protein [Leptomonas pyrrhocoris]KPA80381.1 putative mitochondrial hypothetical protein [Leptomonas pyrrhocoris]|eukprot:XP_015658820.1 putative mitochondrial hypothetical protein [Leptomonas pyrrhocoris]